MNQRWRLLVLWLLPVAVVLIGWQVVSNGGVSGLKPDGPTVAPRTPLSLG